MTTIQLAVYDPETRCLIWSSPEFEPDDAGRVEVPLGDIPAGMMYMATRPDGNMLPVNNFATPPLPEGAKLAVLHSAARDG